MNIFKGLGDQAVEVAQMWFGTSGASPKMNLGLFFGTT